MFKQKWILGVVIFDGLAIIALAIYLIFNFSSMTTATGVVLLILAGVVMISVIGLMIYLTRSLAPKKNKKDNTPQT
jgi:hypothetical protein